tara:strand:+ start:190 stop:1644 length:1455 start_codon:yes stop_codon:yes gene_type:complete
MTTESQVVLKKATLRYTYEEKSGIVVGSTTQRKVPVKVIYGVDKRTGVITAYQDNGKSDLSNTKPSDLTAIAQWGPRRGKIGDWTSLTSKTIPTSAPNDPTWDQLIANSYGDTTNEDVLNQTISKGVNDNLNAEERNLVKFPGVNQTSVDPNAPTADPPEEDPDTKPIPAASSEDEQESVANRVLVRSGSFGSWIYPKELPMNVSDLMQFQIIEYTTRVQSGQENNNQVQTPDALRILAQSTGLKRAQADVKGTINLAIQPPVSDTNGVNWTDTGINLVQLGAAATSLGFIQGGFGGASGIINQIAGGEAASGTNVRDALKVFFAQKASQASNLLSRLTGSVLNPNLETLFEGPRTRSFNYQFQFTPRDESEATEVRSIIRTFKEAMAVKRTESLGFLKAPYVFNIRYLYKGGSDHPYIGRVKGPCALKDMQTDYTPEGSYMTYEGGKDGGSMVKYTITLVFQELDPVYADDYVALGNENIIGY